LRQIQCRPGEGRDPHCVICRLEDGWSTTFHNNEYLGLWVPAFAGTTAECASPPVPNAATYA